MRRVPDRLYSGRRFFERHATAFGLTAYAGMTVLGVLAVASGVEAFLAAVFEAPSAKVSTPAAVTAVPPSAQRAGHLVLTQDNWADMLRDPAYWASRKVGGTGNKGANSGSFWKPAPPAPQVERANLGVFTPPSRKPTKSERSEDNEDETYRTVCVRLCDGAFFPLSFATTREHFEQDAAKCEKSCGVASRMFFYKNPGAEPEDMEDQDGRPYKKLATAFLYKTQYVEQCKCRPHPWEEASTDRHKIYALEMAKAKGSKVADAPLAALKAKVRQAELESQAEKKRLAQAKLDEQKRAATEAKAAKITARLSGPEKPAAGSKPGSKPTTTAALPPPPTSEPTALYQPPAAPRMSSPSSGGQASSSQALAAPKSIAPKQPGAIIMRAGAPQTKATRTQTPTAKPWPAPSEIR